MHKIDQLKSSHHSSKHMSELDLYVEMSSYLLILLLKKVGHLQMELLKKYFFIAPENLCPEAKNKLGNISLNNMTVQRRIQQLNEDFEIKSAPSDFEHLAIDESTDGISVVELLVFVHGIDKFFCLFPMKLQTIGSELLSSLLLLYDTASLNMNNYVSIITDGANSMTGVKIGIITLLKEHLAQCGVKLLQFHCIIHQKSLCGKELGFGNFRQCVSEAINFILINVITHREVKEFLKEFDDPLSDILYST